LIKKFKKKNGFPNYNSYSLKQRKNKIKLWQGVGIKIDAK
jgi:hypothetical protein